MIHLCSCFAVYVIIDKVFNSANNKIYVKHVFIYIQGGQKKSLWWDLEKSVGEILKYFRWSLSLYIFTSSQEVRAF